MIPSKIVKTAKTWASYSGHRFRVGAVVYRSSNVFYVGYNKADKTHPRSPHPFRSIHAEFDAVLQAVRFLNPWNDSLKGFKVYVHRLKKDGSDGLAKPCEWCQKMLAQVGIKEISYSHG